jgi:MFS family permease
VPDTTLTPRRVIRTYYAITGLMNASLALIWGVNTLFLMSAGLDILHVMLVNAAFSASQLVFEVPTGVVADTMGRRASLILCLVTLLVATTAYLVIAHLRLGTWAFVAVSVLLGLGFTFYTGALDAWLVDALGALDWTEPLEPVFARNQMVFGVAMLVGTVSGGLLGQVHLYVPYALRAALLVPVLVIAAHGMKELGFQRRPLSLRTLPKEMKEIFTSGVRYGLGNSVVRPLMFASVVSAGFSMFGFYSWQRYFLDLLGRELVWVTGVIAALVALVGIVGNMLLRRLAGRIPSRSGVLIAVVAFQALAIVVAGSAHHFGLALAAYLLYGVGWGIVTPVRQALLNANIPSAQRATIISLDSLFADLGSSAGQTGWGYLARMRSIGDAWVASGVSLLFGLPFLFLVRRAACAKGVDGFQQKAPTQVASPATARCPHSVEPAA